MLPSNPFPQLVLNRAAMLLGRLQDEMWTREATLAVEVTEAQPDHLPLTAAQRLPRRPVSSGETWGRLYDQRWCRLLVPKGRKGDRRQRYLEWQDQAEATVFVAGHPYYGLDVAHRRVGLPADAREIWVESICVQTGIWHPDATGISQAGSVFTGAYLLTRNDDAWHAYHDLKCLLDVVRTEWPKEAPQVSFGRQPVLIKAPPSQRRLIHWLSDFCDAYDTAGAAALRRRAKIAYAELRREAPFAKAILTGHAHIDLVWLWPERVGEAKAVHTFATVNHLMELYPEFRFAYSQPASYAAVARRAPALHAAVRQRLRSGQWQATGALYVESDTLIACGEALARSFVYGQEDFQQLRGTRSQLVWLPDAFGYSGCLPQLMRLTGTPWFFTNKLAWSAVNAFPYSSFVWRGTDGSEVLAHVMHELTYNCAVLPSELIAGASVHAQAAVHPEFLHPTGYGDGGGGPTEEMCERARRLNALPGLPAVEWDQPEAFFARLDGHREQLPVYQGEFYLEFHRGTYTTHGHVKAAFRALERALQVREAVAVAQGSTPDLGAAWRRLVFAQFHDFIPGSSIPEVYAEGVPKLEDIRAQQSTDVVAALTRPDGEACVFNPLPVRRHVWHAGHWLELPPLSGLRLAQAETTRPAPMIARGRMLDNGQVRVRVGARGEITELVLAGESIALGADAGLLVTYPDRAAAFDAWDIDRHVLSLGTVATTPATVRVETEFDGARASIAVTRRLARASQATVRFIVEAGATVLRIEVDLEWKEPETLLKLRIPTTFRGARARCGAPFGTVWRAQQPGPAAAEAMWEVPASRHVTVTDDGGTRGLSVVTENKYGFTVRDGTIGVSLVRSPRITGFDSGSRVAYPAGLSRIASPSIHSDQGSHRIRLALAAFAASGPRETQPAALADTLFTEIVPYQGAPLPLRGWQGIEGGDTLVPCWAVPAKGGAWVLRLHEVGGERGTVRIGLESGWTVQKIDLRGEPLADVAQNGQIDFRPQEIVSLLFTPERPARR